MALALLSSLHRSASSFSYRATAAFNHQHNIRTTHIHRLKSTSRDDPTLTTEPTCYNHLRDSRPIRIHAAPLLQPRNAIESRATLTNMNNDDSNNNISSSKSITTKKLVHFQRHGQGTHNQLYQQYTLRTGTPIDLSETNPELNPLLLPNIIDAPLTDKGREQCVQQRREVADYLGGVELIVVSPLVRALETASITFDDYLPNKSNNNDDVSGEGVRWIAHEGIREELGLLLCNQRRPLKETVVEFPHMDFSLLGDQEEDLYWKEYCEQTVQNTEDGIPQRESMEDMSHRAYEFLVEYLCQRPEEEIAVVGHSAWLLAMTNAVLEFDEGSGGDVEEFGTMFGQAELRSAVLTFTERCD